MIHHWIFSHLYDIPDRYAPEFAERQPRGPPPQPVPASDFVGLTD